MSNPVLSARGRLGYAIKIDDPERVAEAKRNLAEAKLADYIERVVAEAPPLTDRQRSRLSALINTGGAQ